jgi:hypothetical protein
MPPKKKLKVKIKIKKKVTKKIKIKKNVITIDMLKRKYLSSLDEKEKIAYNIAIEHLGSSFNLEKSIGFQKWLKKNNNNI